MSQMTRHRDAARRVLPRAATVALALGGLTSSIVVADTVGAVAPRAKTPVVSTTTNATYGTILVSGKTLYTLKAGKTSCSTKCLKVWPELLLPKGVKKAKAGSGVDASKLGTVKRRGGALQVTYSGKALYWFSEDAGPGQVNGNVKDKWGTWSVVVTAKPASGTLQPAAGTTTVPTTSPNSKTSPTSGTSPTGGTTPIAGTTPTVPPTTPSTMAPPPPTTTVPTTTPTTSPPTTTTTSPGGGGVGF